MKKAFQKNWKLYLMEASGLAIFMISACFFGGILESNDSVLQKEIPNSFTRFIIMGTMMGLTALFIFYSPFTSPSGAQINPAVTITFLRLGKISKENAFYYIIFQFIGGTLAVYIMAGFMGSTLTAPPVNYVVTIPGKYGMWAALLMEFVIAFIMMTMILFTSSSKKLSKHTKIIAACFVCLYVIIAGPVSGFGMNPARTFASAFPAGTWTALWIYMIAPIISMLAAAEFHIQILSGVEGRSPDDSERIQRIPKQFWIALSRRIIHLNKK